MQTVDQCGICKPKAYSTIVISPYISEPDTVSHALSILIWKKVIEEKLQVLYKNPT